MQLIPKRALVLAAVAALGISGVAHGDTDATSVQVNGGTASMTAPTFSDFTSTILNGTARTKSTTISNWSVNDARGTGAGWEVTMAASALSTGGSTPTTMSGATLTLSAPVVTASDNANASTAPTVAGGDLLAGTVKVADANANQGLGTWTFAQDTDDLTLRIPADARTGTYTSTITTTFTPGV